MSNYSRKDKIAKVIDEITNGRLLSDPLIASTSPMLAKIAEMTDVHTMLSSFIYCSFVLIVHLGRVLPMSRSDGLRKIVPENRIAFRAVLYETPSSCATASTERPDEYN